MSGWGVSILFDTMYLYIEVQFLAILEATVNSETQKCQTPVAGALIRIYTVCHSIF